MIKQMHKIYIVTLIFLVSTPPAFGGFYEDEDKSDWKDPRTRDEDISNTNIKVLVKRVDGLYYYAYEIHSPLENKGIINSMKIDISCDLDFSSVEYPPVTPRDDLSDGKHVPVGRVSVDNRNKVYMPLAGVKPGETTVRFLISPAPPIERYYSLAPKFDNYGWRYDLYSDYKSIKDFVVKGTTTGPECTLDFGPEIEWFGPSEEPFGVNKLLAYAEPITDELLVNDSSDNVVITLFYDAGVDPNTFKAKLDGKDISDQFSPEPDTYETVTINGNNWNNNSRIHLSVLGIIDDKNKGNNKFKSIDNDVFKVKTSRHR